MDDYIDVKIDVFEHVGQRARVRKALTVSALVEEILKEFDDITADSPEKYAVYLKGIDRPLAAAQTLTQLDIQPQDELVFNYVRQTIRQMLEPQQYAFLREDTTGKTYDIQWQPALIGRPTNDVDHNIILAVNVQLLPNGMTVSRRHAQITFSNGKYYIEALADNNPVYVNGREIPLDSDREIKNGDKILIGRNKVAFTFTTQQQVSTAAVKEPRSRPVTQPAPVSQPVSQPIPDASETAFTPAPAVEKSEPPDENATYIASEEPVITSLVIEAANSAESIGQQLKMFEYPFVLGRGIPLLSLEAETSRRHAEITFDKQAKKFYVTDLKSTNGVTLDGAKIEPNRPYEIRSGMRIGLGQKLVLRFEA